MNFKNTVLLAKYSFKSFFKSRSFVGGLMDTRTNKEDFALTPFLFLVDFKGDVIRVVGLGVCWGHYSVYVGIGKNVPKENRWSNFLKK